MRAVEGIGGLFTFLLRTADQGDFRPHDASEAHINRFIHNNCPGNGLNIVDPHPDVGALQRRIRRSVSLIDRALNALCLFDIFCQLTDQDISFFIHELIALPGEFQRVPGPYQVPFCRDLIRIHSITSSINAFLPVHTYQEYPGAFSLNRTVLPVFCIPGSARGKDAGDSSRRQPT